MKKWVLTILMGLTIGGQLQTEASKLQSTSGVVIYSSDLPPQH